MTTVEITAIQLTKLQQLAVENGDYNFNVRTSYSGRAMYDATCVGFVTDHSAFSLGAMLGHLLGWDEVFELEVREDSMGRSTIVYFPNLKLAEGETWEGEDE